MTIEQFKQLQSLDMKIQQFDNKVESQQGVNV